MKNHFLKLFKYNEWANNRIIESILTLEEIKNNYVKALSHLIAVQKLWYDRVQGAKIINEIIEIDSIEGCITLSKESSLIWLKFIENRNDEDFSKMISYKDTKGNDHENSLTDILTHLINHSTYHRAQIVIMLKNEVEKIPVTDYIIYVRNNSI